MHAKTEFAASNTIKTRMMEKYQNLEGFIKSH